MLPKTYFTFGVNFIHFPLRIYNYIWSIAAIIEFALGVIQMLGAVFKKMNMRIIEQPKETSRKYIKEISFLIVTATEIESNELLDNLNPLPNEKAIIQIAIENQTYYLGVLGIYGVVMVQSAMGAVGRSSSLITTSAAINYWNPKAIIMVGIAFGIDLKKQNIGDVIVSSHIIPYENSRVGKTIIYRSELPPASSLLVNRVRQIRNWKFLLPVKKYAKLYLGPILTGEKLIDSKQFLTDLRTAFPNAVGGEMESAGIYAASDQKKIDWLIIKGICDFADGKKHLNKDANQKTAIKSAINFTTKLLESKFGFADLNIKPLFQIDDKEPEKDPIFFLTDLLAFMKSALDTSEDERIDTFKVIARQIVQTETDKTLRKEAAILKMLVPPFIMNAIEERIENCWTIYNETLSSKNGYMQGEIVIADNGLLRCICRELNRLVKINGTIPNGKLSEYWDTYKCEISN
ncbi:hypothetical protein BH11BAC3_BH11BAC3_12220 [soil metagenome]